MTLPIPFPTLRGAPNVLDFDATTFVLGIIFSTVGLGFFLYGKRQGKLIPLVCGLLLMVFPYFISNVIILLVIGVALIAVPYFYRE